VDVDVAVVGGGQAGLAVSHELSALDVEHVVLERGRVGQTWRDRWETFCLVTPNWSVQLPGRHYDGTDPHGFMPRDDIVAYLERYAAGFEAPVREGVDVSAIDGAPGREGFVLRTSDGDVRARDVVMATGAYQRPHRPPGSETLPPDLPQLDVEDYRSERELPDGRVLIVGSGQSGCQIAEELHESGRDVVLACGKAPWAPRRIGAHDLIWWALETGFMDARVEDLPDPAARLVGNILSSGHGGGHDLHYRTLEADGVTLAGHFLGAEGHEAQFAPDLAESVSWGDARLADLMKLAGRVAEERGLEPPDVPEPEPFQARGDVRLDLRDVGCVMFATGFRPDYSSWLGWLEAFDELGFPIHADGTSTSVPGLHFAGVHFLRKRKSSLLLGVGEDASILARSIAGAVPK
jgi:putative flavoprotein involved in K+ transport